MVLRGRPGRNTALGQAHSPAIELCLKRARLAGLFRPTSCGRKQRPLYRSGWFSAETFPSSTHSEFLDLFDQDSPERESRSFLPLGCLIRSLSLVFNP
jgi:hypothetical protein